MIKMCGCRQVLDSRRDNKGNASLFFCHFDCLLEFLLYYCRFVVLNELVIKIEWGWILSTLTSLHQALGDCRKEVELFLLLDLSDVTAVTPAAFTLNTWYNGHNLTILAANHVLVNLVLVRCLRNLELSCPCSVLASSIFFVLIECRTA